MSWESKVRKTVPYVAGEQPKDKSIIKLNTNECPYPPAPGVKDAIRELQERSDDLRLYPDMNASALTDALADFYGIDSAKIFVGVGSDDVLALCFLTFFTNGSPILFPDITYSFYPVWADLFNIEYNQVPLNEEFAIDPYEYMPQLTKVKNGGIIFPNPNAPTGREEPLSKIERIVRANPDSVVIIDEAYIDFGGTSALSLIDQYDNLLVVQTFSKSRSMAGIRIGFAMGNEKLIGYLKESTDRTKEVSELAGATVLSHKINKGKGVALKTGFEYAKNFDIIVTIDADGQHNPSEIPLLIKPIEDGVADLVNGSRYINNQDTSTPKYRRIGQTVLDTATNVASGVKLTDSQSGFRAFSSKCFNCFNFKWLRLSACASTCLKRRWRQAAFV